ncbi:hypothetical protein IMG5_042480 [Ichthyophthirius multifiliis]|uniref:Uncharacterized protein n=1 Tax=Ichthyophthirius multifiliis TaxID=5932 RepID=G0QM32_ICHMU|nr:hypothetical protein IMG5_042480 [Ichthyophthirius multifiliis]EGR33724.1 hypothetical protein IMG5_042480 [Ichthyophthirius multifiliis]|eukprot:XP_004037710.1 hypothetical protein IMG5_042480 [Ichthyophthirius multifiliis]
MIWLRLKLDLLPCIAQEIDRFCNLYFEKAKKVEQGDEEAYKNIIQLQKDALKRIDDIDAFYEKNYSDYRIGYFEKLKIKLRKLLSPFIPLLIINICKQIFIIQCKLI